MRRYTQNTDYRYYSYKPSPSSSSAQNAHYQYYDHRLRSRHDYSSPRSQHHYQSPFLPSTPNIADQIKPSLNHRSNITPLPLKYRLPNLSRSSSISDARLATANAKRERLLIDIQRTISEIDQELYSLEKRASISPRLSPIIRQTIPRLPSSIQRKPRQLLTPLPNDESKIWPNKPKRIYEVIPRLITESKKISRESSLNIQHEIPVAHSTPKPIDTISSHSFIGQYHYAPETAEIEILDNDPENIDMKSIIIERELTTYETFSTDQFLRQQSALPENRALIFVPEYGDQNTIELTESTEEFHQNNLIEMDTARSSTVKSLHELAPDNQLNIQDFNLLIQTAPENKSPTNPILSKPVKLSRLLTTTQKNLSPSQQAITLENNTPDDVAYFFSDFANYGEGDEDLISIDPSNFILPTGSEILTDDNSIGQTQTSLIIPHSTNIPSQQQLTIENNNEPVKETESKEIDAPMNYHVTTTPSKQVFPISIIDNKQTQFSRKNNKRNEDQRKTLSTNSKIEPNFNINLQPIPSITKISNEGTGNAVNNKQQTTTESHRDAITNSTLPVPLSSPDLNNDRPSTSRVTTPERRNSISSIDPTILLAMNDFEDPPIITSIDHLPTVSTEQLNTEGESPSPLLNLESLNELPDQFEHDSPPRSSISSANHIQEQLVHEDQNSLLKFEHDDLRLPSISPRYSDTSDANLTSVEREDTFRQPMSPDPDKIENPTLTSLKKFPSPTHSKHENQHSSISDEEELLPITESQRRSKLSLIVRRSKVKRKQSINDQLPASQTDTVDDEKPKQHHIQMEGNHRLKNWRERIDVILGKKRFPKEKYSHIKSRVNSFANFEYQPKKKSRPKQTNTDESKSEKGPKPQLFGGLWRLPDGSSRIFHQSLHWNVPSKLKSYSLENLHYKLPRKDFKVFNETPKWHSESKLAELINNSPRHPMVLLPVIPNNDEPYVHHEELGTERKIFDIHSNGQQSTSRLQQSFLDNTSHDSKPSNKPIFVEKLVWTKKSKLKGLTWKNLNYQPKKSKVQIFHKPVHRNRQSKIRTRSLSTNYPSLTHNQAFNEKLNWHTKMKARYWSEIDLHQLTKNKALFAQYYDPKWNDIFTDDNHSKIRSDWTKDSYYKSEEQLLYFTFFTFRFNE